MKKMIFLLTTLLVVSEAFAQQQPTIIFQEYPDEWIVFHGNGKAYYDVNDDGISDVCIDAFEEYANENQQPATPPWLCLPPPRRISPKSRYFGFIISHRSLKCNRKSQKNCHEVMKLRVCPHRFLSLSHKHENPFAAVFCAQVIRRRRTYCR